MQAVLRDFMSAASKGTNIKQGTQRVPLYKRGNSLAHNTAVRVDDILLPFATLPLRLRFDNIAITVETA